MFVIICRNFVDITHLSFEKTNNMIDDLIIQSKEYNDFKNEARIGRLSHAFLVLGSDKLIQEKYIKALASILLCKDLGCKKCKDCISIASNSHLAVRTYDNLVGAGGVKAANDLIDDVFMTSYDYPNRVYIIKQGENLSSAVQNKLLKTYEEPPENATIFLLASSDANILTTIKSRATKLYLPMFKSRQIFDVLLASGIDKQLAEVASTLSDGRFDEAFNLTEDEDLYNQYLDVFEALTKLAKSDQIINYLYHPAFHAGSSYASNKEYVSKLLKALDFMEIIFKDVLVYKTNSNVEYMTIDKEKEIKILSDRYSITALSVIIDYIGKAREELNFNVTPLSVIEKLLFKMLESAYLYS